jgi:VanZ family protein
VIAEGISSHILQAAEWATRKARLLLRLLWAGAGAGVIVLSLLSASSAPIRFLDRLHINDKVEHGAAYSLLALLPALHERRQTLLVAIFVAASMGVLLEVGQLFSGGRTFDIADMIANFAGVGTGLLVGTIARGRLGVPQEIHRGGSIDTIQ